MKSAGLIFVAFSYLIWPYYTLLQLGHAVHDFDVMTVNRLVDWKQLRTNLTTQLAENMQTNSKPAGLERMITPGGVIRIMQSSAPLSQVAAFFVSPIRFRLDLTGAAQPSGTVTLFLEFKGTGWQLSDMLMPTAAALGS